MKRTTAKRPTSQSSTGSKGKPGPIVDIDSYLARTPEPARTTLEKLRKAIKAAAPSATETLSYQVPAFHHEGMLVSFGAAAKHCAFYVMSGTALAPFEDELSGYDTSKGTVRFPLDKPLPAALVKKLVRARIAENEARAAARTTKRPAVTKKASPTKRAAGPARAARSEGKRTGSKTKDKDPAVAAFLAQLDHPLKSDIEAVRRIILGVSPEITELIKWNAPSFRTTEDFATFHLRAKDRVRLVFHTGAKVKDAPARMQIARGDELLEWLGKDRCMVTLGAGKDIEANRGALQSIVQAWIAQLV